MIATAVKLLSNYYNSNITMYYVVGTHPNDTRTLEHTVARLSGS